MLAKKLLSSGAQITFTFVGSSGVYASSITVPTGTQTGDLLVLFDRPIASSVTLPTGFTSIGSVSSSSSYTLGYGYRIAQVGDASFTSASSRKILMVFRPSKTINSVSVSGLTSDGSNASPKSLSASTTGASSVSFLSVTHSTGTTADTTSGSAVEPNTSNGIPLRSFYGINSSITLTSSDSNPSLLAMAAFVLQA